MLCLFSVHHIMILFLFLQSNLLLFLVRKKSGLLIDVIGVLFLLSSPSRLSFVSVVFDFNASLNDVAPASLNKLTVGLIRMRKKYE